MNEIEIRVLDMSAVLKPSDAFALVLEELGGGPQTGSHNRETGSTSHKNGTNVVYSSASFYS